MTKLEIFNKLMTRAKANWYLGDDYKFQKGFILDGTNIYLLIFKEDFAKSVWGEINGGLFHGTELIVPFWKKFLSKLVVSEDKWKYIEENTKFND